MGHYLPKNRVSSFELDNQLGLPPGSIEKKSGLVSRYFAKDQETTSYMGAKAALEAVKNAKLKLCDIDVILWQVRRGLHCLSTGSCV